MKNMVADLKHKNKYSNVVKDKELLASNKNYSTNSKRYSSNSTKQADWETIATLYTRLMPTPEDNRYFPDKERVYRYFDQLPSEDLSSPEDPLEYDYILQVIDLFVNCLHYHAHQKAAEKSS